MTSFMSHQHGSFQFFFMLSASLLIFCTDSDWVTLRFNLWNWKGHSKTLHAMVYLLVFMGASICQCFFFHMPCFFISAFWTVPLTMLWNITWHLSCINHLHNFSSSSHHSTTKSENHASLCFFSHPPLIFILFLRIPIIISFMMLLTNPKQR